MKKWFVVCSAVTTLIVVGVVIFQFMRCRQDIPMAPLYAFDMLEATEVTWECEGERIGGNAIINHTGDKAHTYVVITSIVSDAGQKFVSSTGKSQIEYHNQYVRKYGWRDIDKSIRDTIDWPTAHIWCEIRIYDECNNVIFHGIKRSGLFSETGENDQNSL